MAINPIKKAQINAQGKAQVRALIFDKALTIVPVEYSNYSDVFLAKNIVEQPKYTIINDHAIKLEKNKQPLFRSIYSLRQIIFKTLKTYIKINLANGFIQPFKSQPEYLFF